MFHLTNHFQNEVKWKPKFPRIRTKANPSLNPWIYCKKPADIFKFWTSNPKEEVSLAASTNDLSVTCVSQ